MRRHRKARPAATGRALDNTSNIYWLSKNTEVPSFSQLTAPWHLADALWFAAHPKRTFRVRPVMLGELLDLADELGIDPTFHPVGTRPKIIARRPELGDPKRFPVLDWLEEPVLSKMPDYEPLLAAMFEIGFEKLRKGERWASDYELNARIKKLAPAFR